MCMYAYLLCTHQQHQGVNPGSSLCSFAIAFYYSAPRKTQGRGDTMPWYLCRVTCAAMGTEYA